MALKPADPRPMTRRETEVRRFVRARYGPRGTLALHRHALGLDLLRAPVNVMLSPLFLLVRLAAPLLRRIGLRRAGDWLSRRQIFLKSDVAQRIEADLARFIEDLAEKGLAPGAAPQSVARAASDYAETRNAISEITTSVLVLASGLLLFHRATPGVISLAGPVAHLRAQVQAIEDFALGSWAGRMWYGAFPRELSSVDLVLTGAVLAMLASVLTTFAGLVADPVQLWTGIHKRRVLRLLRRLEKAEDAPGLAREHVLARLGDLSDAALSLWRSFRG
ncbi:DUF6635 family protein [Paracoccus sp. P2]|uniref:Uncharacterized protein n=1 Tax=Paracoccus pantotrophus TaxID=82367 RepID=A0A7H9BU11_PARPN|nr:DUF6635 family protein [Paracoccus pantotrophus]MDF3853973.1 hypothetical protein [Paracoccus pantotrophus]QLH13371.1 hypothetical protein HYQ43_03535 [Paracoccus pantotrophus]RDD99264.1 hypothetical protein DTW92_04275 [Paracoccus pantotrophus]RNI16715.1 hypothetical protein EB844_12660 [Paracoccus pantotrophus]WGR67414.1 hypothetical protein E3U24_19550 [Paracoccus pantotrophus]